jgi:PAS domain S-box-containing protein
MSLDYRTLIEDLGDACMLVSAQNQQIVYSNRAAHDLLGYSAEELCEMSPGDIHPHEIPRLETFMQSVLQHGRWRSGDLACRARSSDLIPADVCATRIDLEGAPHVLVLIRELRTPQLAEIGRGVRKLAHDLRNTLATAQLLGERLTQSPDAKVRRSAEALVRSIDRGAAMCTAIVASGRASQAQIHPMRFLLVDLVEDLQATIAPDRDDDPGIVTQDGAACTLDADYDQLYRLLMNLARNAFAAGAGEVRIEPAADTVPADTVRVTICDNGPGLPDSVKDRLFDEKSERPGGSGLGLSIAAEIATRHGGQLALVETGPAGTCFALTLPPIQSS